jgi:peptidoglycan hydrolase CwlO-like protein
MVRGFKVIILGLFITAAGVSGADAQQNPPGNNPNTEQIKQLKKEIQGLQKQLDSEYSQVQVLMAQVKALRDKILPIKEKMDIDGEQLRALLGKPGQN